MASPAVFTETVRLAGVIPLAGLTDSQVPTLLATAVNDATEPSESEQVIPWADGGLPLS
jgi:hypothetical protein